MQAAYSGFFQEAFHMAGLIAGYLLAAWQYQRLAQLAGSVSEVAMGGRERRVPDYFFCRRGGRRYGRPNRPLGHEELPVSGLSTGFWAGRWGCCGAA